MLRTILSISGKPGLYRLVSRGNNMLIVESITTGKRTPAHSTDQVLSLGDIAMYTDAEEVPLYQVLQALKEKENGNKTTITKKASSAELHAFFAEVLPNYDRERVHPGDIKKLITWYNLLVEANLTDYFVPEFASEEEVATEEKTEA